MTCIVGVVEYEGENKNPTVHIGGDSAGVAGLDITPMVQPKVFFNQDYLIGYTDSFRMGQILQYVFVPPRIASLKEDVYAHMVKSFIPALRKCLIDEGFARKDNNVETGGTFMVGYRGRLFFVEHNFLVGESRHGYYAVGCGDNYALGALYCNRGELGLGRLNDALSAAEEHSAGVMKPFTFLSLTPNDWGTIVKPKKTA